VRRIEKRAQLTDHLRLDLHDIRNRHPPPSHKQVVFHPRNDLSGIVLRESVVPLVRLIAQAASLWTESKDSANPAEKRSGALMPQFLVYEPDRQRVSCPAYIEEARGAFDQHRGEWFR
jgi:hypothetical protein